VGEVPPALVTVTFTIPALPAGVLATRVLPVSLMMLAAVVPKATVAVLVVPRFVPVIVTIVPPNTGPEVGLTLVTLGAGRYVN